MDRRNFFKRMFGGTAAAIVTPFSFKWKRDELPLPDDHIIRKDVLSSPSVVEPYDTHVASTKCRLQINGVDYTDVCTSIEISLQPVEFADFTNFEHPASFREFVASAKQKGVLNVTFTKNSIVENEIYHPAWFEEHEWCDIRLSIPEGTTYNFRAIPTRRTLASEGTTILRVDMRFEIDGPVTMEMETTAEKIHWNDEEDPDDNYDDLFDWAEEAELDEEDV